MRKLSGSLLGISLALTAACGDNGHTHGDDDVDAAPEADAAPDVDAPPATDAGTDAPTFTAPTPVPVVLSPAGPDQLQSVTAGPNGTFYAAGFAAQTLAGAKLVTVVKLTSAGALDTTWAGGDGIATTTLDFRGGNGEVGIAVQPSGKIVVSATIANDTNALDRDVGITRLETNGDLDTSFGVGGLRRLDLSTALDTSGTLSAFDAARGIAVGAGGVIYVYALQRAQPRNDLDLTAIKLDADGLQDMTWGGGDGEFTQDVQNVSETARGINVFTDGTILLSGYANSPGLGSVQPLLVKLTSAGVLDTTFNSTGIFHDVVLPVQTEVYNVAVHGTHFVTAGYGRATGTQNDWVSLRFNASTGARDTTWGGVANGAVLIDASGAMVGDNCRNAIALPGGRTMLLGSTGSGSPAQDAAFAVLSSTGTLDASFGARVHTYALGANGNDQFWGGAVSGSNAIMVGYKGGGTTPSDTVNDDTWVAVLPMP
ncbi:MAG TPA: hypothetical protein VM261_16255 [Kofleriaceae bacterium]|nr:hypothetical protein [Kofleriaceae bacterium]